MKKHKLSKAQLEKLVREEKELDESRYLHIPYSETSGRLPDFEVDFELDVDPCLQPLAICQGMRCDFLYSGDDPVSDGIHMIWPEILDEDGKVISDKRTKIPSSGSATMWILSKESRNQIHRKRLKVGTEGFWVVGSKRFARVRVTRILGLFENPP